MSLRTALAALALAGAAAFSLAPAANAAPAQPDAAASAAYPQYDSCGGRVVYPNPNGFGVTRQMTIQTYNLFCMQYGNLRALQFQSDGNLVLYNYGRATWSSGTAGAGRTFVLQADGNMVIYGAYGRAIWSSNTAGGVTNQRRLILQGDGNLVLYEVRGSSGGVQKAPDSTTSAAAQAETLIPRWASNTGGR